MRNAVSVFGLLLASSTIANATTFEPVSAVEQAADADVVIEGDVVRSWHSMREGFPVSWVEVSVSSTLKGSVGSGFILVLTPGGPLADGSEIAVAGTPGFAMGEHVLLHGVAISDDAIRLQNWDIGVLRRVDGPGGVPVVANAARSFVAELPNHGRPVLARVPQAVTSSTVGTMEAAFSSAEIPADIRDPNPAALAMSWAEAIAAVHDHISISNAGQHRAASALRGYAQ